MFEFFCGLCCGVCLMLALAEIARHDDEDARINAQRFNPPTKAGPVK